MSVIRKGRRVHIKNLKKKILVGFVSLMVISVILIGVFYHIHYLNKKSSNKQMLKQIDAVVLSASCKRGEVISKEDITSVVMQMKESVTVCSAKEVIGKRLKFSLDKGTILSSSMFEDSNTPEDDLRLQSYSCIEMTEHIRNGEYVDIRVHFSNGADYIILPKKRVVSHERADGSGQTSNSLSLEISEMDILLLSSAMVDAYYDEHSTIYAISYLSEDQKSAVRTYPENEIVHNLIKESPNVVVRAEYVLSKRIRDRITSELKEYADQTENKKTDDKREAISAKEDDNSSYELDNYFID